MAKFKAISPVEAAFTLIFGSTLCYLRLKVQGIEQSAECVFVGGGDNFLIIKRFGILLNFCFIILFWLKEGNNKIQEKCHLSWEERRM